MNIMWYLESRRAMRNKSRSDVGDPMWEGEFEIGGQQLLDVRSTDVRGLFDLHDAEDLHRCC
jgi:hypothetical protein